MDKIKTLTIARVFILVTVMVLMMPVTFMVFVPMAGCPGMAATTMIPAAGYPYATRTRWFGPMATHKYISAAARFPFFIYPYMPWAWCHNTFIMRT